MDLKSTSRERVENAPTAEQCFEMFPITALNTNAHRFVEKVDQTDDTQLQWLLSRLHTYVIHCIV